MTIILLMVQLKGTCGDMVSTHLLVNLYHISRFNFIWFDRFTPEHFHINYLITKY